mgnify:CR=1 FL=1
MQQNSKNSRLQVNANLKIFKSTKSDIFHRQKLDVEWHNENCQNLKTNQRKTFEEKCQNLLVLNGLFGLRKERNV